MQMRGLQSFNSSAASKEKMGRKTVYRFLSVARKNHCILPLIGVFSQLPAAQMNGKMHSQMTTAQNVRFCIEKTSSGGERQKINSVRSRCFQNSSSISEYSLVTVKMYCIFQIIYKLDYVPIKTTDMYIHKYIQGVHKVLAGV
jgi:hypothetical protein